MVAGVLCALALTFAITANAATAAAPVTSTSLYNAGEVGLSLSSGYVVDRAAAFQQDYSFNLTAGLFYFPYRNFGVEVNLPFYQSKGVSVSEVEVGLLARLPLSEKATFWKNLAPFAGLGVVYNWNAAENVAYEAKVGLEYRLNSKWGVAVDGRYRNNDFDWNHGSTTVNVSLHLVF